MKRKVVDQRWRDQREAEYRQK